MNPVFEKVREASRSVALMSDRLRRDIILALADEIPSASGELLAANGEDLARMSPDSPLYDRLRLSGERLDAIASDLRAVASLPSPLGRTLEDRTLPNGLRLRKVSVPFGVIGVIYEARPNVTFDVFSLCLRSGNACILKGGSDAASSNAAIASLIGKVLARFGADPCACHLLPPTREATAELLSASGWVDVCIPRGGRRLIDFVRDNARVPVIETGAGVVNTYFDSAGDLEIGRAVVTNAKTRRVSVCNALDCLIVARDRLGDLPALCADLAKKNVRLYADDKALAALSGSYPAGLLSEADETSYGTEFMDWKMAVRTVGGLEEALVHIAKYGSGHSEAIITEDPAAAEAFRMRVDAACVYVNAPTSFTDGAQFGLGAEIGISTQKLGPRGPMGLAEMTTYKWLIDGRGQTRP